MNVVHALVVDDEERMRKAVGRFRNAGGIRIEWEQAATASEAIDKLRGIDLLLANMCLGPNENRDGLVVALVARRHLVPHVFLWTGHEIAGDAQLDLHALGIWPFTKAVDFDRLIARLATVVAADRPRSLAPEATLEQIAALMRMVDGRISDVAKQALAVAVEQALEETSRNKLRAAKLLSEDRKFVDRALAWKRAAR